MKSGQLESRVLVHPTGQHFPCCFVRSIAGDCCNGSQTEAATAVQMLVEQTTPCFASAGAVLEPLSHTHQLLGEAGTASSRVLYKRGTNKIHRRPPSKGPIQSDCEQHVYRSCLVCHGRNACPALLCNTALCLSVWQHGHKGAVTAAGSKKSAGAIAGAGGGQQQPQVQQLPQLT